MAGSFKKINASGAVDAGELARVVTQLQANVADALTPLQNKPLLDGQLITATLLAATNTIQHKLGRKVIGYLVVSQSASSAFHDNIQVNSSDSNFTITASVACTVNLWVF